MEDTAYQLCMEDFADTVNRWAERLEPQTRILPQLTNDQLEALAAQLQAAAEEMLTFLDEGETYGAQGRMELLVQVTRQLEDLGKAKMTCLQIADDRRQTYQG